MINVQPTHKIHPNPLRVITPANVSNDLLKSHRAVSSEDNPVIKGIIVACMLPIGEPTDGVPGCAIGGGGMIELGLVLDVIPAIMPDAEEVIGLGDVELSGRRGDDEGQFAAGAGGGAVG